MRRRNWRVILTGFVLIVFTIGFYFFMLTVASQSTDPVALMQTVGAVSGVVIGISVAMIIIGLIGKKVQPKRKRQMSKQRRPRKELEDRKQTAQTVKKRLVLLISILSAILLVTIFRVGEVLWPLWMVEHRSRIVAIILFAVLFLILLSPIIIEFSKNPRALSGPGKNPYIDP